MVVMRREPYTKLDESIEDALDVADKWLRILQRYTHGKIFAKLRGMSLMACPTFCCDRKYYIMKVKSGRCGSVNPIFVVLSAYLQEIQILVGQV